MAEELKVNVSVPGAKASAEDLMGVFDAEVKVGQGAAAAAAPAAKHADSLKKNSEVVGELRIRNANLLNSIRQLGPEFAIAAEVVNILATRATAAGAALALLGTAVGLVKMGMDAYSKGQEQQRKDAEAVMNSLAGQRAKYLDLAEAIEKARLAEEKRTRKPIDQTPAQVQARALAAAKAAGAGGEVYDEVSLAMTGAEMTPQEDALFTMWIMGGNGRGLAPDAQVRVFRAGLRNGKITPAGIRLANERQRAMAPELAPKRAGELAERETRATPEAQAAGAYEHVAKLESVRGRERTAKGISDYLGLLLGQVADQKAGAAEELAGFLKANPELMQTTYGGGEQRLPTMRDWPAPAREPFRAARPDEGGKLIQMLLAEIQAAGARTGAMSGLPFDVQVNIQNQGGTHYHGQYDDAAGVTVPVMAP